MANMTKALSNQKQDKLLKRFDEMMDNVQAAALDNARERIKGEFADELRKYLDKKLTKNQTYDIYGNSINRIAKEDEIKCPSLPKGMVDKYLYYPEDSLDYDSDMVF